MLVIGVRFEVSDAFGGSTNSLQMLRVHTAERFLWLTCGGRHARRDRVAPDGIRRVNHQSSLDGRHETGLTRTDCWLLLTMPVSECPVTITSAGPTDFFHPVHHRGEV